EATGATLVTVTAAAEAATVTVETTAVTVEATGATLVTVTAAAEAAAGAGAAVQWRRSSGTGTAAALTGLYVAAFGGSHPLAKRIGAWPSVFAVTGVVAAASTAATALSARRK
uniref:hypothetical protein n=1 Tax=Streptomyces sp. LS1784 TaxID=2851533 RepID=UPI001CC925E5